MSDEENSYTNLNKNDYVITPKILLPYLVQKTGKDGFVVKPDSLQTILFSGWDWDVSPDDLLFCFGIDAFELYKKRVEDNKKGGPPVWDPKTRSFDITFHQVHTNGALYRIDLTFTDRKSPI